MLLLIAMSLLLLSFILHVSFWRIYIPNRSSLALLCCFFGVLFVFVIYSSFFYLLFIYKPQDLFKVILLYSSCAFAYIIVYSAVEDQSPTLAIAYYLKKQSDISKCDDAALQSLLKADEGIKRRILSMEKSGFIQKQNGYWLLTNKGRCIAALFALSATIFGLTRMGG